MTTYYPAARRADGFVSLTHDPPYADRASAARQLQIRIAEGTLRAATTFIQYGNRYRDPHH